MREASQKTLANNQSSKSHRQETVATELLTNWLILEIWLFLEVLIQVSFYWI